MSPNDGFPTSIDNEAVLEDIMSTPSTGLDQPFDLVRIHRHREVSAYLPSMKRGNHDS